MPGQRKRSKSATGASRTLFFDEEDAKDLIKRKYVVCRSFDDLCKDEYIELGSLAKSEKSKNFLLKLISNFDKKNKYKLSGDKDANNEFLRKSYMKTSIPRITSSYYNSSNKSIQPRILAYDKLDKMLSNKPKPILSKRYCDIFEQKVKFNDNFISSLEPISTIVKNISENKKENLNNTKEQSNQRKTIKEMLSNLIGVNKNSNKHKYEKTEFYDKYDFDHQIYNLPVIPRVMQMVSNDNNNKDQNNIDINRSATIRPIYGIKRNHTTPIKSFETFQPKDNTLHKKISNYNYEISSGDENYGDNLIKPSAIKRLAKELTSNVPQPHQEHKSPPPYQNKPQPSSQNTVQPQSPVPYENNKSPNQDKRQNPSLNKINVNANQNQSQNINRNLFDYSITQREIQKNHMDLCKFVLNQCRLENNYRNIMPHFSNKSEVKTTKSDKQNNVEWIKQEFTCQCESYPMRRYLLEDLSNNIESSRKDQA
ncbi:hypothetical protein M0802_011156 [Mischocyttarus mexicanus]|nr:hypothetical protein M0802_011156 [Mischocyttarus mexicanus]